MHSASVPVEGGTLSPTHTRNTAHLFALRQTKAMRGRGDSVACSLGPEQLALYDILASSSRERARIRQAPKRAK